MTTQILQFFQFFLILIKIIGQSLSSPQFYYDVLHKYKGYGLKYLITLSLAGSLIISSLLLYHVDKIQQYLRNSQESTSVILLDQVIKQLPEMEYDGKSLSSSSLENLTISLPGNIQIIALDFNDKLAPSRMIQFPIILRKNNININIKDQNGELLENFVINYSNILGNKPKEINRDSLQQILLNLTAPWPRLIIYSLFPILSVVILLSIFFDKIFLMIGIFVFFIFTKTTYSFKDVMRLISFSSGFLVLFSGISLFLPYYVSSLITMVSIWINILMILGIVKDRFTFLHR